MLPKHAAALLLSLLAAAPPIAVSGQGFTLQGPDSSRLTLGGRVHVILDTSGEDAAAATATTLRRVRLEAGVVLNPLVSMKIQPEYAGSRVSLRDAHVVLSIDPALQVVAGQMHRPFGAIAPGSSNRSLPVERGLRVRGLLGAVEHHALVTGLGYAERDVGVQLRGAVPGAPLGLAYAVGLFDGPARDIAPAEDTHQLVARVTARPSARARGGVSWSRRDFAAGDGSDAILVRGGAAWGTDLELGSATRGPRLLLEAARGDLDPFAGSRFASAQGWLAYRGGPASARVSGIEPLLRVSWADPDRGAPSPAAVGGTLVTPGVNVWLGGLNRIALNLDHWSPARGPTSRSVKLLFQVAF
jgi:hypothetical protein